MQKRKICDDKWDQSFFMLISLSLWAALPVRAVCPVGDLNGDCMIDMADFALLAQNWLTEGIPGPTGMVLVSINGPGVTGHEGFNGDMSKYEMTNGQYCEYLNAALASGDITVSGNDVNGASGSNTGADFVGKPYYDLAGAGETYNGATKGGAARINWPGSVFAVDSGFENHPVSYVSWYGATAFSDYYG